MTVVEYPRKEQFSEMEWQTRLDLAACYRAADLYGFSDIIWNHITAKIQGTEHFLINRFGYRFDEVTASNLVTIDLDGNTVNPGTGESEIDVNITGFVIHGAVHSAREDVRCVMHSHSNGGMAVSALREGLIPMQIDGMMFLDRVAYHNFEGLSDAAEECDRLAASLGEWDTMILRNHGLLTCGETVGAAFMRMYYLERACNIQLRVMATGRDITLPSDEVCERTAKQLTRFPLGQFEWPAILRQVQSQCPDYNR